MLVTKLHTVSSFQPFHNFTKGDPIEDLQLCARKLDLLLTNLGMKGSQASPKYKVENDKVGLFWTFSPTHTFRNHFEKHVCSHATVTELKGKVIIYNKPCTCKRILNMLFNLTCLRRT